LNKNTPTHFFIDPRIENGKYTSPFPKGIT